MFQPKVCNSQKYATQKYLNFNDVASETVNRMKNADLSEKANNYD